MLRTCARTFQVNHEYLPRISINPNMQRGVGLLSIFPPNILTTSRQIFRQLMRFRTGQSLQRRESACPTRKPPTGVLEPARGTLDLRRSAYILVRTVTWKQLGKEMIPNIDSRSLMFLYQIWQTVDFSMFFWCEDNFFRGEVTK